MLSLLGAVGTVQEKHDGKFLVTVGPETETLRRPRGKDVDEQTIVDLRRLLREAGLAPDGAAERADERTRDFGDSRRGEPA